ncbi:MAG TPA: protein kinase, partial [Holophagaceae bacterium]|nr:protein kinase [Holophagaceae bacterium]
ILLEARAQAKVEHPNICKIYEVGDHQGQPFIAMQRIQGDTLEAIAGSLTLEQKVLIIQEAAEALHAAHRVGLIHRDLKPANIMVEQGHDGGVVPFVMDFGLAREVDSKGLTVDGHVMGTPAYMSPEQAGSGAIDRRCDVYGLGATLYWLCSGHQPFEGESMAALFARVLYEEAPRLSLHAPQVPRDLETIVMKCLEKAPGQRYDSARALAEDLHRFLEGEPILARPAGFFGRMARRAKKHKAIASMAAVSAAAVIALGAWGIATRLRARARAQSAQRFGQVAEQLEGFWRQALLLPAHDLSRERDLVQGRMQQLGLEMARLGSESQGPGHYALGRAHLALRQPEQARLELQRAWDMGYRSPELSLALGEALGQLYQRGIEEARSIPSKELRRLRLEDLARTLREPALARLQEGSASLLASPALVAARQALLKGELDAACRRAQEAFAERPWLFEARILEGRALLLDADQRSEAAKYTEAWSLLDQAESAFGSAQTMARSDPETALARARVAYDRWWTEVHRGGPARPWIEALIQRADEALALQPDLADAWLLKAHVLRSEAIREDDSSPQRLEDCRQALACARQARDLAARRDADPHQRAECELWLGACFATLAATEQARGTDPGAEFASAVAALEAAARLDRGSELLEQLRGDVYGDVAAYEEQRGRDPRPRLEQAVGAYKRLLERHPSSLASLNNLGYTYKDEGRYLLSHGQDPEPAFALAEASFRRTTELSPAYAYGWNNLCVVASYRARYQLGRGQDPAAATEQGLAWGARAVEANAKDGHFHLARMEHWIWRARHAMAVGGDPEPAFAQAESLLAAGVALRPQDLYSHFCSAWLALVRAEAADLRGQDAKPFLRRAEAALALGLASSTGNKDLLELRAEGALLAAGHGGDAARAAQALADARAVLAQDPQNVEAALAAAEALRLRALKDPSAVAPLEEASALLEGALRASPGRPEAQGLLGACLMLRAEREPAQATGLRDQARKALEASLGGNRIQASPLVFYDQRMVPALLKRLGSS